MKIFSLSALAALSMLAIVPAALAQTQTSTTTTWTNDQGSAIQAYSTTQKYPVITDTTMNPDVGFVLPGTVTVYPLPADMKVQDADNYDYTIVNNHPIVIDRTTRKVVHIWSTTAPAGQP